MIDIETPTNQLVDIYVDKFKNDERYLFADQAITNLFQMFPENKKLEDVLLKISVLNDLYSTNIFGTFILAKHILQLNIDEGLEKTDPTIVNKIAVGHGITKPNGLGDRCFYSFATKYCNWHKKEAYPIYDSFVDKILIAYRNRDNFSTFTNNDLKDFTHFKEIITDFRMHYNLTKHSLKEIDKFLWIYGKTIFPNNYRQKHLKMTN
jgi:hypothetical protein